MKTILLSLILAVIAAVGYLPTAAFLGVGAYAANKDPNAIIQIIAWIFMGLVAQPILVVPYVLIAALVKGAFKIAKKDASIKQ